LALGGQDIIFRSIIKTDNMKTVLEQLMEIQDQVDSLKMHWVNTESFKTEPDPVCDGYSGCGCGCDEPPVEIVESAYVVTEDDKYAGHVHLTKAELIDFATRLTERVLDSVKKAVTETELNADDMVTLELNSWSNTIEMELDNGILANNINSEIEDAINLDPDSISDEIDDIFGDMYLERIS
jgi:hypothetical protein